MTIIFLKLGKSESLQVYLQLIYHLFFVKIFIFLSTFYGLLRICVSCCCTQKIDLNSLITLCTNFLLELTKQKKIIMCQIKTNEFTTFNDEEFNSRYLIFRLWNGFKKLKIRNEWRVWSRGVPWVPIVDVLSFISFSSTWKARHIITPFPSRSSSSSA